MNPLHQPWEPLSPQEVADELKGFRPPWWIAGGFAVELAVGWSFRAHGDIDVGVFRTDLPELRKHLGSWEFWAADPPGQLVKLHGEDEVPARVHDLWCRPLGAPTWRLQVMLYERDATHWISRRDARVRYPLHALIVDGSLPYLAPEVQLYFKAKSIRAKGEEDLHQLLRHRLPLDFEWLVEAIAASYGADHRWLDLLNPTRRTTGR